jgi:hypothetical protein
MHVKHRFKLSANTTIISRSKEEKTSCCEQMQRCVRIYASKSSSSQISGQPAPAVAFKLVQNGFIVNPCPVAFDRSAWSENTSGAAATAHWWAVDGGCQTRAVQSNLTPHRYQLESRAVVLEFSCAKGNCEQGWERLCPIKHHWRIWRKASLRSGRSLSRAGGQAARPARCCNDEAETHHTSLGRIALDNIRAGFHRL